MDTKEMAILRRNLDSKHLRYTKNDKRKATARTKTTNKRNIPENSGIEVTNKDTDTGPETEAMKRVRCSLQLNKSTKRTKDNLNTSNTSIFTSIGGASESNLKSTKLETTSKKITKIPTNKTANEDKPSIETDAMKKIRLGLELKNKSKRSNSATATTSTFSSNSTIYDYNTMEETDNNKSLRKAIKRKAVDVGIDKNEEKGLIRKKLMNTVQESYPNTSETTIEGMDIDDDDNIAGPGIGSNKNDSQETIRVIEKTVVETEAMRIIRSRLELKNSNKNQNASSSTGMTSTASLPRTNRVVKENIKVISPKAVKRKTATIDKPTEEMQRMKELIEQRKSRGNDNCATSSTTPRISFTETNTEYVTYEGVPISSVSNENTCEINPVVAESNTNFQRTAHDEARGSKHTRKNISRSSLSSSHHLAMSMEVKDSDSVDKTATSTRNKIRSKTWERRIWKQ